MSKKIIVALVIIVVIIMVAYLLFLLLTQTKPEAVNETGKITEPKAAATTPQITQAKPDQLPENFPKTIPLNGKEKITQAYDANYAGTAQSQTATQSSVIFKSDKSMTENYAFYTQWAKDNGYEIINQANQENLKFVYLRKDSEDINITIIPDSVNISYAKF